MLRSAFAALMLLSLVGCIDTEQDYVAVVGVGEAKTFPTSAKLSLTLRGTGDSAAQANQSLAEKVDQMRAIVADYELTDENIQSVYFNVLRESKMVQLPDGSRESVPGDFVAEQYFAVTTLDIHNAGQLLGALTAAGPEDVSPPIYQTDDTKDLFEKARALAIEDATTRAAQYVSGMNKQLGSVEIIEESGNESQRLEYKLRDRIVRRYEQKESGAEISAPALMMSSSPRGSRVFTRPEEISVSVSVYVKFALDDL